MSTSDQAEIDEKKERVTRFLKFAGFLLVLVVGWYSLDLAAGI